MREPPGTRNTNAHRRRSERTVFGWTKDDAVYAEAKPHPKSLTRRCNTIRLLIAHNAMALGSFSTGQVSTATPLRKQRWCARGTRIATLGDLMRPYTGSWAGSRPSAPLTTQPT